MEQALAYWNGTFCSLNRVEVSPLDRGYLFGDGVYEVIRIYNGSAWLLADHLRRLAESLAKVRIAFEVESLTAAIAELVGRTAGGNASLYIQVTRGVARRGHAFPNQPVQPSVLMYTEIMRTDPLEGGRREGVRAITLPEMRWSRPDIKSLNLLPNCMAKQDAVERGAAEAVFFDSTGLVTEGSSSNVFWVARSTVYTPIANARILSGVTRAFVLGLCRANDIPLRECNCHIDELRSADEVFVTGTMSEILPVVTIDQNQIGTGRPGPRTTELQRLFTTAIRPTFS